MTKEQKQERKHRRCKKRRKHQEEIKNYVRINNCSFEEAKCTLKYGNYTWEDSSSPTGFMQRCDYQGDCQFPCNGDC